MGRISSLLGLSYFSLSTVRAQDTTTTAAPACSSTISAVHGDPSVAPGWRAQVVASGLNKPRSIVVDPAGRLLVVELGYGISRLNLDEGEGPCVRAAGEKEVVIEHPELYHGLELSPNGKTLYASTPSAVYAWDYDPVQGRNTSGPRELINDFGEEGNHVTRTLLLSRQVEGMLIVSRGSVGNLDENAQDIASGVSTIKAFNISIIKQSPYSYIKDGLLLGWGLRNSVGVAEDPVTGGIWSVENSVDDFERAGQSIHQNNPGEELNFHGYLNGTQTEEQGENYGYPSCFATWDVNEIPNADRNLEVGQQIAIGNQTGDLNDAWCQRDHIAPRLTFAAHTAPLDIKFENSVKATAAFVTFHGSWNRDEPIGYKLSMIRFENGSPTEPSTSTDAAIDIVSNRDLLRCPDECFRPVGLAWGAGERLFMSSDSTGEIFVITRDEGSAGDDGNGGDVGGSATAPTEAPSPTGAAVRRGVAVGGLAVMMVLPLVAEV
ncbi:soluble quino protein glucose dehydrogenase [Sporormia fimetaria CBS 119925]|uniref:Soluble quino protein glucose dehydrogenase n=1 Tax=Sporormia fimetaria CBS 119925 TaxID=1340428 RepID=A0A6A6V4P0_9PLEO|nr:soluble quino protein glucose dehydrogenase [Sporormia fimetaria CBS 119925]